MSKATYRPLSRAELDVVLDWASAEGWNPGLNDAEAFWAADPEGFYGVELEGELVGSKAIVSYAGELGFKGLFIVKPEHRHKGLGAPFWHWAVQHLRARLKPEVSISLDGVFAMQAFYAKGGFVFTHRNLRMEGMGEAGGSEAGLVELSGVPFTEVAACDRRHFGAPREAFLQRWISPRGGLGVGLMKDGRLDGMGVVRPCERGYKIGPLFAGNEKDAGQIFDALSARAVGKPLFLDIPECNPAAVALAERHGLKEVFGCARMVLGPKPATPWERIFGVTTFELG